MKWSTEQQFLYGPTYIPNILTHCITTERERESERQSNKIVTRSMCTGVETHGIPILNIERHVYGIERHVRPLIRSQVNGHALIL